MNCDFLLLDSGLRIHVFLPFEMSRDSKRPASAVDSCGVEIAAVESTTDVWSTKPTTHLRPYEPCTEGLSLFVDVESYI